MLIKFYEYLGNKGRIFTVGIGKTEHEAHLDTRYNEDEKELESKNSYLALLDNRSFNNFEDFDDFLQEYIEAWKILGGLKSVESLMKEYRKKKKFLSKNNKGKQ